MTGDSSHANAAHSLDGLMPDGLLDRLSEVIVQCDKAGRILAWRGGGGRFLGLSDQDVLGRSLVEMVELDGRSDWPDWPALHESSERVTLCYRGAGGRAVWHETQLHHLAMLGRIAVLLDVDARERARQQVEEATARIVKLAANVPGVLYQFQRDANGHFRFPFATDGLIDVYGVTPDEVAMDAGPALAAVHEEDLKEVFESVEQSARELSLWRKVYRSLTPEGNVRWLEGEAKPEPLGDGSVLWHGYIREVTEQKQAEQRLQASETLYRAIFNNVNDSIILHGVLPDGRPGPFEQVNEVTCRLLGYSREELLNMRPGVLDAPDQAPDIPAVMRSLHDTGHATFDTVLLARDGARIECEVSAHQFSLEGRQRILSVVRDITQRKAVERHLRQALEMQEAIIGASPVAIVTLTPDALVHGWNAAAERMFGWDRESVIGRPVPFLPAGKNAEYDDIKRRLLRGELIENLHLTRLRRDGTPIRVALSAASVRDGEGRIAAFVGMLADVTAMTNAQEALRRHARVFESSREGIVITDGDHRIVSVNAAYTEITGYPAEELIGREHDILSSGRIDSGLFQQMHSDLSSAGHWQGELNHRRKDGSFFPLWFSVCTVLGENGQVESYIAWLRDLTKDKENEKRIDDLSNFDPLTGLPNRSLFQDRLEVQIAAAGKTEASCCVLYLDLDRFKIVNDSMGTAYGDVCLRQVGARLAALLRPTDTVSRIGGDEFALLLPDTDAEGAAHVVGKVQRELSKPMELAGQQVALTVSAGIAVYPEDGHDFQALLTAADIAVNRAKEKGRNTSEFFTSELQEMTRRTLQIETDLREALAGNRLTLHYQPQVELTTGAIVGAEALLRWQHPELGDMSPAVFIPIAEETDLIVAVGHWVLEAVLQQQMTWREQGLGLVPIAVNLSAREFRQQDLVERIERLLALNNVAPSLLKLEITERVALDDWSRTIRIMRSMHALGVEIALDDFGTGYSSLAYLKRFSVSDLKIDQSFVQTMDSDNQAIVTAIMGIAESLGFNTIAEGIETAEQADFLVSRRCRFGQGYFFSRPLPAPDFARLLLAH